jgi:hypothetical protein
VFLEAGWHGAIDHELPTVLTVGAGTALVVGGWLYHEGSPIRRLRIRVLDRATDVRTHSMPRADVYRAAGHRRAYASGFWTVVDVPQVDAPTGSPTVLEAVTRSGARLEHAIAHTTLMPGPVRAARPAPDLVVVCMTTHNPPLELLERQVESIRAQTHGRWRCLISDDASEPRALAAIGGIVGRDARFEVRRVPERLGFYFNFEAVLGRVPPTATYVALADQDDVWAPHKLATLVDAVERDGAVLAYSDQRIVDVDGRVLSPTYSSHASELVTHSATLREYRVPKDPVYDRLHGVLDGQGIGPECSGYVVALASATPTVPEVTLDNPGPAASGMNRAITPCQTAAAMSTFPTG